MQTCRNTAEEHNKTQKLFQILDQTQFCPHYYEYWAKLVSL